MKGTLCTSFIPGPICRWFHILAFDYDKVNRHDSPGRAERSLYTTIVYLVKAHRSGCHLIQNKVMITKCLEVS